MIGKGDAHPFVGYFLSRYEREPQACLSSGSSPSSFSLSAKGACEKSPKRLRSQGSLLFTSFHRLLLFRESLKPLELCLHTGRKKKENLRRRKGSSYDALGELPSREPWKTMGKAGDY